MKWLKHLVESGDDPDIMEAIIRFKSDGYYVFFRVLEIMAREFNVEKPGVNTFAVDVLRKKLSVSWQKTVKILQFYHKKKRIFVSFSKRCGINHITLNCPKLKELCDEYTQKILKEKSGEDRDKDRD